VKSLRTDEFGVPGSEFGLACQRLPKFGNLPPVLVDPIPLSYLVSFVFDAQKAFESTDTSKAHSNRAEAL